MFQITPPLPVFSIGNVLTKDESKVLSSIDESLCNNSSVIALKNAGKLEGFIEEVQRQFKEQARKDFSERVQQLTQWGLKPTDSLQDLEVMAQRCLNTHYDGIKIGTSAFYDMVSANFLGDSNSIIRKAKGAVAFRCRKRFLYPKAVYRYCERVKKRLKE